MKFSTVFTSALAFGSVFSNAIPDASNNNTVAKPCPENSGFQIRDFIKAETLYDGFQKLSKIPKDKFVQEVKKTVDEVQGIVNISYDFEQRVEHLDAQQIQQITQLWTQVFEKLSKPLPHNLKELELLFKPESLKFLEIIYRSNHKEKLEYVYKLINELYTF